MLSNYFFDWWFSPWKRADSSILNKLNFEFGCNLSERDAYQILCKRIGINSGFPNHCDAGWAIVLVKDAEELRRTARLFAAIIASRQKNVSLLKNLSFSEQKWCAAIAGTQPINWCINSPLDIFDDSLELIGIVELAGRLNDGFPGLWERLQLLLDTELSKKINKIISSCNFDIARIESSATRAQRCWRICYTRHSIF